MSYEITEANSETERQAALAANPYLADKQDVPFTTERKAAFLEALAQGASVTRAARVAGVSKRNAYYVRASDEAFKAAWAEKLEEQADGYEDRLYELSLDPKTSVPATIFALKSLRGDKWRDRHEVHHSGDRGGGFRLELPAAAVTPLMALLRERLPDQAPQLNGTVFGGKAREVTNEQDSDAQGD